MSARTDEAGRAYKGSQLQIQIYVNRRCDELNAQVTQTFPELASAHFHWVSPLEEQRYLEYRDEDFLKVLGLSRLQEELTRFWPRGGPCWDALADRKSVV